MSVRDRLSVAAAVAVLLATSALFPVFDSLQWLPRTVGAVLVVALASALARGAGLPRLVQPVVTLVALGAYLVLLFAAGSLSAGVVPGPRTVDAFRRLSTDAGTDLADYGPPAPVTTALALLVVAGVGAVAVVVDALASVARRPAVAGLPLLALFAVPSAVLPGGLGWLPFVLGAAGWLALLLVEGHDEADRWGTPLRTYGTQNPGLTRVGRRIGAAALGVAVLVPALLPGLDGRLFDGGSGDGGGPGGGSRSIVTYNPITQLRGQLNLPTPITVLRYSTNDPQPDYLRMTTLSVYDGSGWRQDVLRGNVRENGVAAALPRPVGQSADTPVRLVQDTVELAKLEAYWLPLPATPTNVRVDGPWMWDPKSQSVFATRSTTSKVKQYSVRSDRVLPDPALLTKPRPALPAEIAPFAAPIKVTPKVRDLSASIVRGQTSDYGKAAALQAWFRDPANHFVYSNDAAGGGAPDALEGFLNTRRGFCEQYASAMAAMLRLQGVPSRVAVGFTPGTKGDDGDYTVTTSDAHAWPEAWFEGAGWVRFEPTPSQGRISPPVYGSSTDQAGAAQDQTEAVPVPQAGAGTTGETAEARRERLAAESADAAAQAQSQADQGGFSWRLPLTVLGVLLLALAVLGLPWLAHVVRRRRRWRSPSPAVAWDQLREDATDLGHPWSAAETPRTAAARLVAAQHLDAPAASAVGRLATAVERARFAPPGSQTEAEGLAADSAAVRKALRAGVDLRPRLRATLLPGSTLRWASSGLGSRMADLLDAADRLLSRPGDRLRARRDARRGAGRAAVSQQADTRELAKR